VRRNIVIIGTALAAALLMAGCSSSGTGSPGAASTTTADSSTPNLYGAPHVANPLDTSKVQQNPCGSITSAQLATFNIGTTTKVITGGVGPGCDWSADDPAKSGVTLGYLTAGAVLSSIYYGKSTYAVFKVWPAIDGYPAVSALSAPEPNGMCDISVGMSDSLAMDIQLSVNSGQYVSDPCTPNQQLVADIISNIKNGG
jgi:uncharacterized protein DUF3558